MEGGAHAQLDARHLEEVPPDVASEDGVTVADDRRREPVKPDNVDEERTRNRGRRVGVAERYEVGVLREAVDHHEYDALAVHLGESFNEVQRNVSPNL